MSHRLSVALGDRRSVVLARSPLADAIQAGLHGAPRRRSAARRAAPLLASALALSLAPALAQAEVITVDSALGVATPGDGLCQLPEAIANANAGSAVEADCAAGEAGLDSIVFDPSLAESTISLAGTLMVGEPLDIDGAAAPELVIAGDGGFTLIDAYSDLSVSNLTLASGDAGIGQGGAIRAASALSVANVAFFGNSAKYGGAIDAQGSLDVTDSYFAGNTAEGKYAPGGSVLGSGGAISSYERPTITGSTFVGNTAAVAGGAVHAPQGATIIDSTFGYNEASFGGAVMSGDAVALVSGPQPQGVPYAYSVELDIADSTFAGNLASHLPGGETDPATSIGGAVLFLPRSSPDGSMAHALTITGSEFSGNAAILTSGTGEGDKYDQLNGTGGAVAATLAPGSGELRDATEVAIDDSLFENNLAAFGGGAVVLASSITVDDSVFHDNVALIAGGASLGAKYDKYDDAVNVALAGTTFSDNAAYVVGGALLTGSLVQASDLTITGNIAGEPTGDGPYPSEFDCASGAGKYGGAMVYAETLSFSGDNLVDGNCAGRGGGLSVYALSGSIGPGTVVSNNQATASDGMGGGLLLRSDGLLLDGVAISGNSSNGPGGGLLVLGAVTLSNSTVSGNAAGTGGGLYAGVPPEPPVAKGSVGGQVTLLNTTIHGNTATAPAITAKGTGAVLPGSGGGIAIGSGFVLDARFATITQNGASDAGGGIWLDPAATATLSDSIVAGNTAPLGPDIAGSITAQYSLVQDPAGATFIGAGTGNQTGLDPLLGPLQDNGGPTQTRMPLAGSPVIDSGDPAFTAPPAFDQRGAPYPRIVNGVVDKGAVEASVPAPQLVSLTFTPASVTEGSSASITVTLDGSAPADVLVTLDFSGDATAGLDYTVADADPVAAGIQVLVAAGASEGSIALQALLDGVNEPDESVTATVTGAVGADLPGPLSATGTIVDGDGMPMASLSLGQATILEEGGSTTITVSLSVPSAQDVTITLGFSGTAIFGTDYSVTGTQIVIPAGQTSGSVVLNAIDDADDEGDETVVVDILSVSNGLEAGVQQATIVIDGTADGSAPAPGPGANPQPAIIPTLSEWMLMLLGLLLPVTVVSRLRRAEAPSRRR